MVLKNLFSKAQQQASQIQALATAEAEKTRIMGEGEAKKIQALAGAEAERAARVGVAQAMAIQEQVRAYGGPKFQLTQQVMSRFAEAIQQQQVDSGYRASLEIPRAQPKGRPARGRP